MRMSTEEIEDVMSQVLKIFCENFYQSLQNEMPIDFMHFHKSTPEMPR